MVNYMKTKSTRIILSLIMVISFYQSILMRLCFIMRDLIFMSGGLLILEQPGIMFLRM